MIVTSDTDANKHAMWQFLYDRGVRLHRSEDFQAIGRVSPATEQLIGVVAYNGFCGNVCQMHIAGDGNWVSREFIRAAFDYPFRQLGLAAVLGALPADNHKAMKFDTHFGMREVHRITNGWANGVDLVLVQMNREDCKWLREGDHVLPERKAA